MQGTRQCHWLTQMKMTRMPASITMVTGRIALSAGAGVRSGSSWPSPVSNRVLPHTTVYACAANTPFEQSKTVWGHEFYKFPNYSLYLEVSTKTMLSYALYTRRNRNTTVM